MFDFSQNHFDLFGLPVAFDVDTGSLAARYRALQQAVHPDRFATAGAHGQRLSLQAATRVNEAHATLRDPLTRACYLLELGGIMIDAEATVSDPTFLAEQMALREALDEVHGSADPRRTITELLADIDGQLGALVTRLAALFALGTAEALDEAKELVHRTRFLRKFRDQAADVEADLEEAC
jgi:molecular chaperone HscB